jgi:hypothetical protein
VSDDAILTAAQRRQLVEFTGMTAGDIDDEELVGAAAERVGMTGELAIDADGVLELERGDVLVVLESVAEEDAGAVEHPELLHLGIYLKADGPDRRAELEEAGLLDPPEPDEPVHGTPEEDGWAFTWWGALCTQLPREAGLPEQMQVLERIMNEAEAVLERGEVDPFFARLGDIIVDDE